MSEWKSLEDEHGIIPAHCKLCGKYTEVHALSGKCEDCHVEET